MHDRYQPRAVHHVGKGAGGKSIINRKNGSDVNVEIMDKSRAE